MSLFEAKARHTINLEGGGRIQKGEIVKLRSTDMGVRSLSLFSSPERREKLSQQLAAQGISGIKPHHLSSGSWDVKERK